MNEALKKIESLKEDLKTAVYYRDKENKMIMTYEMFVIRLNEIERILKDE